MAVHPGEWLMSEILLRANLSIRQVADQLDIPADALAEIVCGRERITASVVVRLAQEFDYSREWWLGLQTAWDDGQNVSA